MSTSVSHHQEDRLHRHRPLPGDCPTIESLESRLLLSVAVGSPVPLDASGLANLQKMIVAGDPAGIPPDSPGDRVDPNTTDSLYAGVGSLRVTKRPYVYIGTATPIGPNHVLTAAHMLDLNDKGRINVKPRDVVFNLNYGGDLTHQIAASALYIHPDWTGFLNPSVNDDVAVIELSEPLPDGVPFYWLNTDPFEAIETATLVGYGMSGDGVNGYTVGPQFDVKREGGNLTDFYDVDDEGTLAREVFEYDFDWPDESLGFSLTPGLGNDVETTLGGGDSGGPAFIDDGGDDGHEGLEIFGINTFTFGHLQPAPYFGSGGGGIVVEPYVDWINSIIAGDPPLAVDDAYSVNVNNTLTVDAPGVLGNDSDPDGDPLTAVPVAGPTNGTLILNEDGSFSYTPDVDFTGSASFTYKANDGTADSNVATVTITVAEPGEEVTVTGVNPIFGSPGERLTVAVHGSNFQAGATADFGERIAVQGVAFISDSQLDVRIKIHRRAASGARDVTVTNPDGSSATGAGLFTVDGSSSEAKRSQRAPAAVDVGAPLPQAQPARAAQPDEAAVDVGAISGEIELVVGDGHSQGGAESGRAASGGLVALPGETNGDAAGSVFNSLESPENPLKVLDEPDLGGLT